MWYQVHLTTERNQTKHTNQLQVTDVVSSTPYHRKESNTQTLVVIETDYYIQDVNLTTI